MKEKQSAASFITYTNSTSGLKYQDPEEDIIEEDDYIDDTEEEIINDEKGQEVYKEYKSKADVQAAKKPLRSFTAENVSKIDRIMIEQELKAILKNRLENKFTFLEYNEILPPKERINVAKYNESDIQEDYDTMRLLLIRYEKALQAIENRFKEIGIKFTIDE